MEINWIALFVAALVPLLLGFVWYHPKVFGNTWMKLTGLTMEDGRKMNMPLVFGLTYLFGLFIALQMNFMVIHQAHLYSLIAAEPNASDPTSEAGAMVKAFMDKFGHNYRTFKHGAFHGILAGLFLALPLLAINSLFERKSWSYIFINAGYWIVCLAVMGGIICAF
ncbi:MAG: DUF1761 domain-containing protein [Saprospiraceae bacterium]